MSFIIDTKESKTISDLNEVSNLKDSVYTATKFAVEKGFNTVWNNPRLTPQEVFNIMGTESGYSLNVSKYAQLFLRAVNPEYQLLIPTKEYVVNEDGTVTVSEGQVDG